MFNENEFEILEITTRAKALHAEERRITLQSVNIVAELDAKRASFHLGVNVEQLALMIGLTPSQYFKRLKACKIMEQYPDFLTTFEKGETPISHIAMIGNHITPANAKVIAEGIRHKSKREVEDLLSRVTSNGLLREHEAIVEKTFRMTESQAAVFNRVLEVAASCGKVPSAVEGLLRASEAYLNTYDPMRIAEKAAERRALRERKHAKSTTSTAQDVVPFEDECENELRTECETDSSFILNGNDDEDCGFDPALENAPPVANEPGETYSPEELADLSPLERIQAQYKNKRLDPRRPIRKSVKNRVWLRDEGVCTFIHGNGERCKQRQMLEIDHTVMVCRGGTNDESNLTLKCRYHNQLLAERELGVNFMKDKRRQVKSKVAEPSIRK